MPRLSLLLIAGALLVACRDTVEPSRPLRPLAQSTAASAVTITKTDLEPLFGGAAFVTVGDINNLGHIAGTFGAPPDFDGHAFLWTPERGFQDIGAPPGPVFSFQVKALNDHDVIVGQSAFGGSVQTHAFRWSSTQGFVDLGVPPGTDFSAPLDVNNDGQVVGDASGSNGSVAFLWTPAGGMQSLGQCQSGFNTVAQGVNTAGQIAGACDVLVPGLGLAFSRAFLWTRDRGFTQLGTLGRADVSPFNYSNATAINDRGQIAGESDLHTFVWTASGGMQDLGIDVPGNDALLDVSGINNSGLVVGNTNDTEVGQSRGYVFVPDQGLVFLDPLGLGRPFGGEGSPFSRVLVVNDAGQVLGESTTETGEVHATLWTIQLALANRPPTASIGGPYTGAEGSPVAFDAGASSDPDGDAITFAWDFGDGATATGVAPTHTYAHHGTFVVTLTVTDARGLSTAATTTASIENVPPTVGAIQGQTILQGETFNGSGSFTDPGTEVWTATVDYGDGSGVLPLLLIGKTFSLTHVYGTPGTYTVTVMVADDGGGVGVGHATVIVQSPRDALQTLSGTVDALVQAGQVSAGNGNALDAKLRAAIAQLARGNTRAAVNQLNAFINQVTDLVSSGVVSPTDGQTLIDAANRVLRAIQNA